VFCYSGGTEATDYSLWQQNIGTSRIAVRPFLKVKPCLQYKIWNDAHPIIGFSKTYDDSFNPQSAFAAILTCSQADGPFLLLVLKRIPITFEDPKHLIIHPTRRKNRKKRPNRYGAFLCILKNKKIMSANCTPA
jgi:arsenate reductase